MLKKTLTFAALLICISSSAFAANQGKVETIFPSGTAVAGTGSTVVSRVFTINSVKDTGFWAKTTRGASAGSTIRVSMVMQASFDTTSANFATVTTINALFPAFSNEAATVNTLVCPAMKYVRFVTQGTTGNATDTTIEAHFFTRE